MRKKAVGIVLAVLCYSIALAGVFYFVGYKAAYDHIEASASTLTPQTFYATITDIRDHTFAVTGMEVNDINFRGKFTCSIVEETKITWRYTDISINDLLHLQAKSWNQTRLRSGVWMLFNCWMTKYSP